jgi:hypothetical protein
MVVAERDITSFDMSEPPEHTWTREVTFLLPATMTADRVVLDDNRCLRKATDRDRDDFVGGLQQFQPLGAESARFRYLNQADVVLDDESGGSDRIQTSTRKALLLALRVASPEWIEVGPRIRYDGTSRTGVVVTEPIGWSAFLAHQWALGGYTITEALGARLRTVWPGAMRAQTNDKLRTALSRLDSLYGRSSVEDMLIDCWVALESLFVAGDKERFDINERCVAAKSFYLGVNDGTRNQIRSQALDSYRLRSRVMHGSSVTTEELQRVTLNTCQYLRDALFKLLAEV